jgi:hypothetical protein
MNEIGCYSDSARSLVQETKATVLAASAAPWDPADGAKGHFDLMLRAILRKQFDALSAIIDMTDRGIGYAAVPLLRPACEELIWVAYLTGVDRRDAADLLLWMGALESYHTFMAQEAFAKERGMADLGFPAETRKNLINGFTNGGSQIARLGKKLGWKKRTREGLPTVSYLSSKTGHKGIYKLLYHASSKAVHFSVPELMRRVWGEPGKMDIDSAFMERYWAAFALYWAGWLYACTFCIIIPEISFPDESILTDEMLGKLQAAVTDVPGVPILTLQELAWPFSPS